MNELLMLGNPLLRINDKPLVMRDKKGLGLIAYLAVNGETNRDKLADLLWSELNQTDARRNLRQRLYELKTKIPSQILFLGIKPNSSLVILRRRCKSGAVLFWMRSRFQARTVFKNGSRIPALN
jgi:DNA-binding SARP family transcriptional activator